MTQRKKRRHGENTQKGKQYDRQEDKQKNRKIEDWQKDRKIDKQKTETDGKTQRKID